MSNETYECNHRDYDDCNTIKLTAESKSKGKAL